MNLEFQSAATPKTIELRGTGAKIATADQSRSHEQSMRFKELLSKSQQDIRQTDQKLQKAQEKSRESQPTAASRRQQNEQKLRLELDAKSDGHQVEKPEIEEVALAEDQQNNPLASVDAAQLMGVQNIQGDIATVLTRLNLNSLSQDNQLAQETIAQVAELRATELAVTEKGQLEPETTGLIQTVEQTQFQALPVDQAIVESSDSQGGQQLISKTSADQSIQTAQNTEAYSTTAMTRPASAEVAPEITKADASVVMTSDPSGDTQSDTAMVGTEKAESQQSVEPAAAVTTAIKTERPDETAVDLKLIDPLDSTPAFDTSEEILVTKLNNSDQPAALNTQAATDETEIAIGEEKSSTDINVSGINTTKSSDIQPDSKVEVAQQVQQKILQNFEPNKPMVLQMTLSPDNLGDIDIKLSYDQGKLIIDITAISQETQNLLGKQINLLVRGLALQNVQVETVHVNTPVEQSSDSQDASFLMNNGSDPNENKNQAQLRERFIKNSAVLNSFLTSSDEDESVMIPPNLQNYSSHKVNYLI